MMRSVDLKQLFKLYKQNSIMSFVKLIKKCFLGFSVNIWSYSFSVPVYFVKFIDAAGVRQMKEIAVPSYWREMRTIMIPWFHYLKRHKKTRKINNDKKYLHCAGYYVQIPNVEQLFHYSCFIL